MSVEELNADDEAQGINPVAQPHLVLANSLLKSVFWECRLISHFSSCLPQVVSFQQHCHFVLTRPHQHLWHLHK